MRDDKALTIDGRTGKPDRTPPAIRLKTTEDVRLEMARVYRDMREGRIETADGTKMAYVLAQLIKTVEATPQVINTPVRSLNDFYASEGDS